MAAIRGLAEALKVLGRFDPIEFPLLIEFLLRTDIHRRESTVELLLQSVENPSARWVRLRFTHVKDLNLIQEAGRPIQISGLEIYDVSNNQLEGINWRVRDFEDSGFRFWCRDVEILAVGPT